MTRHAPKCYLAEAGVWPSAAHTAECPLHTRTLGCLRYGNKYMMQAVTASLQSSKGVFSIHHAMAIVRLIGSQKLGALINELCQNVGL